MPKRDLLISPKLDERIASFATAYACVLTGSTVQTAAFCMITSAAGYCEFAFALQHNAATINKLND